MVAKQPHANICGAKTRAGHPCRNRPMANGRCRMHGGKSTGAPKNNKNAVTHGAYEQVIVGNLSDVEKAIFDQLTAEMELDQEIKIQRLKLVRLLARPMVDEAERDKGIVIITEQIRKLIETKHKLTGGDKPVEYEDDGFLVSLENVAEEVWGDYDDQED